MHTRASPTSKIWQELAITLLHKAHMDGGTPTITKQDLIKYAKSRKENTTIQAPSVIPFSALTAAVVAYANLAELPQTTNYMPTDQDGKQRDPYVFKACIMQFHLKLHEAMNKVDALSAKQE